MVAKELKGSGSDLETAKASYEAGNHKWATVQAYYSIFHAARALLYNKGFREKSHRGLLKALAELYPRNAMSGVLEVFEESMRRIAFVENWLMKSGENTCVRTSVRIIFRT